VSAYDDDFLTVCGLPDCSNCIPKPRPPRGANIAKVLEGNPTLMRLRELEVLE
jgi:hypothetical protein